MEKGTILPNNIWKLHPFVQFLNGTNRRGVDFIKDGRMAQIIEIALLKLGTWRKVRSTPLRSFSKAGRRAQNSSFEYQTIRLSDTNLPLELQTTVGIWILN